MEFLSKLVGLIGGMVGIIGGILGIMSWISSRKREKQEDEMWNVYVNVIESLRKSGKNVWNPSIGSSEHKLAEKMVEKGWLERAPARGLGGYSLPHTIWQ